MFSNMWVWFIQTWHAIVIFLLNSEMMAAAITIAAIIVGGAIGHVAKRRVLTYWDRKGK